MRYISRTNIRNSRDFFAQAKALRFAARHKELNYQEAKSRAEALLREVNTIGEKIAKKYGRRYRKIRFSNL
jgi:hypothetical protein